MRFDWVSFTTDYGTSDGFVAACHGVIARIAPTVRLIDVTHQVPPQDVRRGAALLAQTIGYLPRAVHLAVVDPGVGGPRRPVALRTADGVLVGPDNGLLPPAADRLGGVLAAVELTEPGYRLAEVSATFHGRDVFAPAAAHLAAGVALSDLGPALDPAGLVRLPEPETVAGERELRAELLGRDHFGNLALAATGEQLARYPAGARVTVTVHGHTRQARLGRTFTDVPPGALVVYPDSTGQAAVAEHGGSAWATFAEPAAGAAVTVRLT